MITTERISKLNLIVEAASDTIKTVVLAIADPDDADHRADWLERYGAIVDLNILTASEVDEYLEVSWEHPDRYPYIAFFIDEVVPNPTAADNETFIASLGYQLGVQGETFAMVQREIFEIHHALRSILFHDKSLGEISGLGGVISVSRWIGFRKPRYGKDEMRKNIGEIEFYYEIGFTEDINR
jgi:hypothetical protein